MPALLGSPLAGSEPYIWPIIAFESPFGPTLSILSLLSLMATPPLLPYCCLKDDLVLPFPLLITLPGIYCFFPMECAPTLEFFWCAAYCVYDMVAAALLALRPLTPESWLFLPSALRFLSALFENCCCRLCESLDMER